LAGIDLVVFTELGEARLPLTAHWRWSDSRHL